MCGSSPTSVLRQFPSTNCIISDLSPYSEKAMEVMVLSKKTPTKFRILIRFALMENKLLRSPYRKGRF